MISVHATLSVLDIPGVVFAMTTQVPTVWTRSKVFIDSLKDRILCHFLGSIAKVIWNPDPKKERKACQQYDLSQSLG